MLLIGCKTLSAGGDGVTHRLQSTFPRLGQRYSMVAEAFPSWDGVLHPLSGVGASVCWYKTGNGKKERLCVSGVIPKGLFA